MIKYSIKKKIIDGFTYLFLTLFSLAILLPILWVVRTSLATDVIAYQIPPKWFFTPSLENYRDLFVTNGFLRFFGNSLIISIGTTLVAIPIATLGAFAFTRFNVGGRPLQFIVLGTQMLPGIIFILPIFVIFNSLKLTDTYIGVIIAYLAFNLPFLVWLLMGFFEGLPQELENAAAIDGLSPFETFIKIVIPISAPGVMAAAVLSFILCWNEFLFALVLTGGTTNPVPVGLAAMATQRGVLIGKLSAGTTLAILPMIIISFTVRKYLVRGLTFGAIK